MQPNLFLMFNHRITPAQQVDAFASLGINDIISMPERLQHRWSHIPPELKEIHSYLEPFEKWLRASAKAGDFVLIQGDFGACYLMVHFAMAQCLVPIYSSTRREAEEEHHPDGSVTILHYFRHGLFRRYGA
ncbi:MAG TPA: hypothetical protein DEO88_01970 [Syntrophobacteraceae bacterium]|jgi:hypothetical protein|nr:hypothetical protein [Syntrophobacteraceae bacterium]